MNGVQPWVVVALLAVQIGIAALVLYAVRRLAGAAFGPLPLAAAATLAGAPTTHGAVSGPDRLGSAAAGEPGRARIGVPTAADRPAELLDEENRAIETALRYVQALLSFERAEPAAREQASRAVREAADEMDAVFGVPGEQGTVWPVPPGAPTAVLEEIEWRCHEALRRRRAGARAVRDSTEAVVILSRRAGGAPEPRPVVAPPAHPDPLAAFRLALQPPDTPAPPPTPPAQTAAGTTPAAPAPAGAPFYVDRRLEFARWLVQTGRLSDEL